MSAVEFHRPDVPTFDLRYGPWLVQVFDPRADGAALGARYVHGGYIAHVTRDGRVLTAAPKPAWDSYNGIGLPEVFEESLGFGWAEDGEEFLRIGAGRVRKDGPEPPQARGPLTTSLNWTVTPDAHAITMETADGAVIAGKTFSYQLRRTVRVEPWGLLSHTWLKVRCPWSHPLSWFPHPFFLATSGERVGYRMPAEVHLCNGLRMSPEGLLRLAPVGGFGAVTALWGRREPIDVLLDESLGGGCVRIETSYPLDKAIVWGAAHVSSIEPYWGRAWHDNEEAQWHVLYRWVE